MPKVILVSTFPLPYPKIGSWTNMYRNYFESGQNQIDTIVCEAPENRFDGVKYALVKNTFWSKIRKKLQYYRVNYVDALLGEIKPNERYVIQFVDNYVLARHFHEKLVLKGLRQNCHVQFFYHGYEPFVPASGASGFFKEVDELILLTNESYKAHLAYYTVFPVRVSILYNGIDTSKFSKVNADEKHKIREDLGLKGDKVFVWCSQDRPKKGLAIVLDAWKSVSAKYPGHELLIIGTHKRGDFDNVRFVGKIPNDELPKYFQASDCYLFPTLCHEGFGLTLIEALNCGCHCIASEQGGVPEVLQFGKLGRLIEKPNFVSEWQTAMEDFIEGKDKPIVVENPVYTLQEWVKSMNVIIANAKNKLS
ncbi:glycosyltransferase family 4 protein [Flavobacterium sp.]|uniref:glycosyltransferase family 4 protein n=1 Tax=Flavobacterium sp. TaxID=239 RepID=UPI001202FDD9|nr:glycosyltransferase family 4 protein [Flavobacterium sp.]RZJ70860.1 MAG: glycosyltransferase [Flavobacterium sp.]